VKLHYCDLVGPGREEKCDLREGCSPYMAAVERRIGSAYSSQQLHSKKMQRRRTEALVEL
jgi:hypothetical protein